MGIDFCTSHAIMSIQAGWEVILAGTKDLIWYSWCGWITRVCDCVALVLCLIPQLVRTKSQSISIKAVRFNNGNITFAICRILRFL